MSLSFPVELTLGPLRLSAHWIFQALAYVLGYYLYSHARRASGDFLSISDRFSILAGAAAGAVLGSKILYLLEDPSASFHRPFDIRYLLAGRTIVGGLLGATIAVEWLKSATGIQRRTGDLFALAIPLAIATGRAGCFLAGLPDHTFGVATGLPWGVDFGDGVRRHPTQIYELLFMLLLALWIQRLQSRPRREGDLFRMFLVTYLAFRLCVDFLKPGVPVLGLTAIQWACVAGILAYWRDFPFLLALAGGKTPWAAGFDPTSSMTQQPPSAPSATAGPMARLSSKKAKSTY